MTHSNIFAGRTVGVALLCLTALGSAAARQQQAPPPQKEDVVRISTEAVQTVVMVFDKEGRFVFFVDDLHLSPEMSGASHRVDETYFKVGKACPSKAATYKAA